MVEVWLKTSPNVSSANCKRIHFVSRIKLPIEFNQITKFQIFIPQIILFGFSRFWQLKTGKRSSELIGWKCLVVHPWLSSFFGIITTFNLRVLLSHPPSLCLHLSLFSFFLFFFLCIQKRHKLNPNRRIWENSKKTVIKGRFILIFPKKPIVELTSLCKRLYSSMAYWYFGEVIPKNQANFSPQKSAAEAENGHHGLHY